jgi:hypothetical protein
MAETVASRRKKLAQVRDLVDQLIALNEACSAQETSMENAGISDAENVLTMTKMLTGGGPPQEAGPAALAECIGDTVSDRIINLLNDAVTGGISWTPLKS